MFAIRITHINHLQYNATFKCNSTNFCNEIRHGVVSIVCAFYFGEAAVRTWLGGNILHSTNEKIHSW